MTNKSRTHGIWVLALLVAGASGCATRGYVRNQVETNRETLSADIENNRLEIEETQQGLNTLRVSANETHTAQEQALNETRTDLEATQNEVTATQSMAENAGRRADAANARGEALARMFDDRSRFEVRVSHEILFGFDSDQISEAHQQELEAISSLVASDPNTILVLEGRTDSSGESDYNAQLGERRVEAVRHYLVMELEVPVYRIHGFSYGEARPAYDNQDPQERARNRSVTALVYGPVTEVTEVAAIPE